MSNSKRDWSGYYRAVEGRPPRQTLLWALEAFEGEGVAPGLAIDLGAGSGRDALELLRRGWSVLAIDGQPQGLEALRERAPPGASLETRCIAFEELTALPPASLINASFSLPFCHPLAFPCLWGLIRQSLLPHGRLAGQLMGDQDDWAGNAGITAFARPKLDRLVSGYHLERLEEERSAGATAKGKSKFWHLYHIVLKRLLL